MPLCPQATTLQALQSLQTLQAQLTIGSPPGVHALPFQAVPETHEAVTVTPEPFGEVGTSDLALLYK